METKDIESPSGTGMFRYYQRDLAENITKEFANLVRKVIAQMPTGAGKSILAIEIVVRFVLQGKRVLFVAHRAELIFQFSAHLGRFNVPHGIIMGGHPTTPDAPVQVASVQTLSRRRSNAPPADLIIIDECHRTMAATYQGITGAYPEAFILGLTATPKRTDNKPLGDAFDKLLVGVSAKQLVKDEYLVEPEIFVGPTADLSKVKVTCGDYDDRELSEAMSESKLCGNIVTNYATHALGRQVILFAVNVMHSKLLAARFKAAGVTAEHVDGLTPAGERAAIISRFKAGQTSMLCNVDVCTEGFDAPCTSGVILAAPTKSETKYLQAVGRVMRPAPGKTDAIILDHAGCVMAFGRPTDERVYVLRETENAPAYREITTKQCPHCEENVSLVAKTCPHCGEQIAEFEARNDDVPDESEVILIKLDASAPMTTDSRADAAPCPRCGRNGQDRVDVGPYVRRIICCCGRRWHFVDNTAAATAPARSKTAQWEALCMECRQLGFKPGWAAYKYKELWAQWPKRRAV